MDGQDFEGWTRSASGGSKVTTAPIVPEGKEYVDLYAQWDEAEPKTVTLNFVTNGGSRIDDVKVNTALGSTWTEYVTEREGYAFAGWYSDRSLTKRVTSLHMYDDENGSTPSGSKRKSSTCPSATSMRARGTTTRWPTRITRA